MYIEDPTSTGEPPRQLKGFSRVSLHPGHRRLHLGRPFVVGRDDWYLLADRSARGVMKVRRGIIEEVGIANRSLTNRRAKARRFLGSVSTASSRARSRPTVTGLSESCVLHNNSVGTAMSAIIGC
jgi:hypothetical protein